MSQTQQTMRDSWWIGIFVTALVIVLVLPGIRAWFYIINEWEIVETTPYEVIAPAARRIEADLVNFGRFRPLYWLIWHTQRSLIQDDVVVWHLVTAGMGVVTCLLLFGALRPLVRAPLAGLGVLLLLFYPRAGAIWYNLVYQETSGTLLVALAAFAAVQGAVSGWRGWDVVFAVAAILVGFIKENYALLLPALIGVRLTLQLAYSRPVMAVMPALFAVGMFFIVLIAVIGTIYLRSPHGYGQVIVSERPIYLDSLARVLLPAGVIVPALAAGAVWVRRKPLLTLLALGTLALWVVPQVGLYNERIQERFLYPAIVGSAGGAVIGLYLLRQVRWRGVAWVVWAASCLPFLPNLPGQWTEAARFADSTYHLQSTVETLTALDVENIVVQIDPKDNYDQYEAAYSVTLFLRHAGYAGRLELYHPPNVPMEMLVGYVDNGFYSAVNGGQPDAPTAYVILNPETRWEIARICQVDPCPEPPVLLSDSSERG